eukprot:PhF_6_TR39421/c0_g1_i1/m.58613
MLEVIVVVVVVVLGAVVFLSLGKSKEVITESAAQPAIKSKPKKEKESKKKSQNNVVEYKRAQGRTISSLGMEADVIKLTTTEDRAEEAEKRRAAQDKARKQATKGAEEDKKEKVHKKKEKKEEPKVDVALEIQKKAKAMNSRIEKFVKAQTNTKRGRDHNSAPASIVIKDQMRASSAPWKAN